MTTTLIIIVIVTIITVLAPFICLYAIRQIKQKKMEQHIKVQKRLFFLCVIAVLALEGQIRFSGGSGSLIQNSPYIKDIFFNNLLIAHIVGAIITYVLWIVLFILSNRKYKKENFKSFASIHKKIGYIVLIGLFYTAITAVVVVKMAFFS